MATLVSACIVRPAPATSQRRECLRGCAGDKDSCVLAAHSADAIQACDEGSRSCGQGCPP